MTSVPNSAGLAELARLLREHALTPLELVEHYARRIDLLAEKSRAFISLDLDSARARAAATQIEPKDHPLKGIPYTCKDLFDVRGIATTGGSRVLQDNLAAADAEVITRLDRVGANYIGKTNLHEFAYGATGENQLYGTCPNPWDAGRLAGGSSSGSAAAVGLDLCAFSLGTDTGGSVRAPAALCGLVGFKPTLGRISTEGVIPFSWTLDHVGTLTRNTADAATLFEVLAQDYRSQAQLELTGLTIGLPEGFFFDRCDTEILDQVDRLRQTLAAAGATFKTVKLPSMTHTRTVALTVQMPEALSYHSRYLEQSGAVYSPDFRAGLALGQNLLAEQYVRALRLVETYRRGLNAVFEQVDLLLTPACPIVAPEIGATEITIDGIGEPAGNAITRYTSFFNLTGHPAITFPCGMHSSGLPLGAQLVGRHHGDEFLLAATQQVESARAFKMPAIKP